MTFEEIINEAYKTLAKNEFAQLTPILTWPKANSDCIHMNCPSCKGTGIKSTGGSCIHGISCPCKNCRTYS